jgi:large repetitive protein
MNKYTSFNMKSIFFMLLGLSTNLIAQDNCATAVPFPSIPVDGTCANLLNQSTTGATNSNVTPTGDCAVNSGSPTNDIWFSFVATSTTQTFTATYVSGATDVYWQVFSGACGATMTSILCTDVNAGATLSGLTIGQTYYIRLYTYFSGTNTVQNICLKSPTPLPINDECASATNFPAISTTPNVCSNLLNQSTEGATNSGVTPSGFCTSNGGTPTNDVWFSFVATSATHNLIGTWVSGATDVYWQVFSSTCAASMTSILCTDNDAGGVLTGLTIGATYKIRLYTYFSGVNTVQNICLQSGPPAPANDNCAGASSFPAVPTNGTCSNLLNQSTGGVTNSSVTPTGSCTSNFGTPDDDVWFSFVATSTTQILSASWVSGATDVYWQVFSGACAATMTSIFCTDTDIGGTLTGLTIGTTYRIKLYTYAASATTTQNICIQSTPPPPANNNCAGATIFPAIPTNGTCSNLLNQSTNGATNSSVNPSGTCTTNVVTPDDDVWFSFVATATTHLLSASYVSGLTDVYWQVFSSNCAATMTSIFCSDNDNGGTLTGLTIGNTYRIRLFTYALSGNTVQNICLQTAPPPPANDNCAGATSFPAILTNGTCSNLLNQSTSGATNSKLRPPERVLQMQELQMMMFGFHSLRQQVLIFLQQRTYQDLVMFTGKYFHLIVLQQ